jgi:hypothetical protein
MYDLFRFFMNFVSSCVRYVHGESMCTGYIPLLNMSKHTCFHIVVNNFIIYITVGVGQNMVGVGSAFYCCWEPP